MNLFKTLGEYLDSTIKTEELKLILATNTGYYHDDPYSMSLIYFGAGQASFFNGGGHFIKGGAQKLSDHIAGVIISNGGKILLNNLVMKIIIEKGKAAGVEYKGTPVKDGETKKAFAKVIIANTAIPNVVSMLSGKEQLLLKKITSGLKIACSLTTIHIYFKKELKKIGNKYYSTFVSDDSIKKLCDMQKNCREDYSKRCFVFVDYSQIDSNLVPKGKKPGDYLFN